MTEPVDDQIHRLARFIMDEVPGEPSQGEGAIDCAIRLIREAQVHGRIDQVMKVYLAGPMTGLPGHNFEAFNRQAKVLRDMGHKVFNPAEEAGDSGKAMANGLGRPYYMRQDIFAIIGNGADDPQVDAVVVLPGWEQSRGARLEVEIALQLDIEVLWAYSLNPVTNLQLEQARALTHDEYLLPDYEGVPA